MKKSKQIFDSAQPPSRAELSDNPVKLCNEIARIFRARMRERVDSEGVMSQEGARLCMSVLAISDGISQRALVEKTHLRPPTVSLILKRMADEGLVKMLADDKDMRVTRVYLTERGREIDRESIERIRAVDARGLRTLSESEKQTLMELLYKIRENLLSEEDTEK